MPVPTATTPLGAATTLPVSPVSSVSPPPAAALPVSPPPAAPAKPASARPAPAAPVVAPLASAESDTCWRVQVGAPAERARGTMLRDASQSQLLVPMIVDREAGRFKVRTRDCLGRKAAESVRDRAVASGFKGVFLVRYVEKH